MGIEGELREAAAAVSRLSAHAGHVVAQAEKAAGIIAGALRTGGKVLLCGNGGSAAQCQHMAAELTGRFRLKARDALAAISLTADTAALTAISNDFGLEAVFARQVDALGGKGDVLVALSTSGRSPNVLSAIEAARIKGMKVVALTSRGGGLVRDGSFDALLKVPSIGTARIQECHLVLLHAICGAVEDALFGKEGGDDVGK